MALVVAVVVSAVAWGLMFALPRDGFWPRALAAGVVIGVYAVAVGPARMGGLLDRHHWPADLLVGVGAGLALYGVFWLGLQTLVVVWPRLVDEVGDLYAVKGRTRPLNVALIAMVAAAGEELMFRGLLWARGGVVVGLVVYGAVHLWERKVILVAAAVIGGAVWGALLSWTGGLVAPLASHLTWGLLIIVVRPVRPALWARRLGARLRPASPGAPGPPGEPGAGRHVAPGS